MADGAVPTVSVIIPVYNAERFLEQTVEAVLGQTVSDWELLLVDDGSSDRSPELARRYAADLPEKVRYAEHPGRANHRQFATRLLGARLARADVLALLDADDVWDSDYLEKHLALWEKASAHGIAASYGPSLYWYPENPGGSHDYVQPMPPGVPKVFAPGELLEPWLEAAYATTPCPSCTLIRREVFDHLERFRAAAKQSLAYEDQILAWYTASRWPVLVHDNVWVRYRQSTASSCVSTTASADRARRAEQAFLTVIREYLGSEFPDCSVVRSGKLAERSDALRNGAPGRSLGRVVRGALRYIRRLVGSDGR